MQRIPLHVYQLSVSFRCRFKFDKRLLTWVLVVEMLVLLPVYTLNKYALSV